MSSKNLSRDQKRKAKLAERDKRSRPLEVFTPYSGRKYQVGRWTPVVFATEQAIHDVILESKRELLNSHVQKALVLLIDHLRNGGPPGMGDAEATVPYSTGDAAECVFFNVRKAWRTLADDGQVVAAADFIGIARTLLYSIEAHASNTSRPGGYVRFLEDFIPQASQTQTILCSPAISAEEAIRVMRSAEKVGHLAEGYAMVGDILVLK